MKLCTERQASYEFRIRCLVLVTQVDPAAAELVAAMLEAVEVAHVSS